MTLTPSAPRFEHHPNGRLGIGESSPRLSWTTTGDATASQQAVRFEVTRSSPQTVTPAAIIVVETSEQVLVPWPDEPLDARESVTIRVSLHDGNDWGPWGSEGWVERGLMKSDWTASFIAADQVDQVTGHDSQGRQRRRPMRLRHRFELASTPVSRARLYVSAHGVLQPEINGTRIGDEELTPGWTSYQRRIRYATFDVSDQLHPGMNSIGLWLGDG